MAPLSAQLSPEAIPGERCLALARSEDVGHLSFIDDGVPTVVLAGVSISADDQLVLALEDLDGRHAACHRQAHLIIDHLDPFPNGCWSVDVRGFTFDLSHVIDAATSRPAHIDPSHYPVLLIPRDIRCRRLDNHAPSHHSQRPSLGVWDEP